MKTMLYSVVVCLMLSFPHSASADCNLSGKSLVYVIELCAQVGCSKGREKITILGDKVLLYNAPSEPVGLTFILGQSVDLCSQEFGDGKECYSPSPRLRITSAGKATYQGGRLRIEIAKRFFMDGISTGQTLDQLYLLQIFEPQCNACKVLDVSVIMPTLPEKTARLSYSDSCQVSAQ